MGDSKSPSLILLLVLITLFLVILGVLNYSPPKNAVFDVDGFYSGTLGETFNPKELYDSIYTNVLAAENACHREMLRAKNVQLTGNGITWIVDGQMPEAGSLCTPVIKPYTELENKIVSPADMTFVNSNVLVNEGGLPYIEAKIGSGYIIRWEPVDVWWCHIGKRQAERHTEVYGASGSYASCVAGWVIGQATPETEVRLWKVQEDGNRIPLNFSEYFSPEE